MSLIPICLCQHRLGTLNYSFRRWPIIVQTVPFPAQILASSSGQMPPDHIFAHRQRRPARRGLSRSQRAGLRHSACLPTPTFPHLEGGHSALLGPLLLGFDFCFGDSLVDFHRRSLPHIVGDMGVSIQRGGAGHMAQDSGQRLDVHLVGQGVGGEGVPILYSKDKTENPHKSKGFYLV